MRGRFFTPTAFAIMLSALWTLLFLKYLSIGGFSLGVSLAYACVFAAGHAAEFGFILLVMLLLFSFLPRRAAGLCSVLLGAGMSIAFVANYFAYRQFRIHIDLALMSMFFGKDGGEIFVFPPLMYVQATLAVVAVLALATALWAAARRAARKRPGRFFKLAGIFFLLCIPAYHGITAWASFNLYTPITTQLSALPLVQPLTMNRTLRKLGFKPAQDLPRFSAKAMQYPLAPLDFAPPQERLNLVVVLIDGWRFDMLSQEVTPNIYEFSRRAMRFNQHNSSSNHTRHGVFSFFYGLPGTYWDVALAGGTGPALMDAFIKQGYALGLYASATMTSPEFYRTVFVEVEGLALSTQGDTPWARDREITNKFTRFLDGLEPGRPFFSYLFYDSTHAYTYDASSYTPKFLPDDDNNYFSGDRRKDTPVFNRYKNSVGYVDSLVGEVLQTLEARGLLENTVVIVSADHAQEFDDLGLGYSGHNGNFSKYQTGVPLLLYWPGRGAADYDHLTSHLDIAPTLMRELLGCISPVEDYSNGASLFAPERDYAFMMGPSGSYGILQGGVITVFPLVGASYAVDAESYQPVEKKLAPELYRKILQDLSRFKR